MSSTSSLDGVLVIDKPPGPTSAGVVARVRRALSIRKAGHTGTLDPMATGVLPVCVGKGTRIARYLVADDKAYLGELVLGVETDTLDAAGEITGGDPSRAAAVTEAELRASLEARRGEWEQRPPMYSAVRQGGVRLHQLARRGVTVERPPRPIRIDSIELLAFEPPRARIALECSKGTYVRSLVADVGAELGCGAHLAALRRTRAGRFTLAAAVALDELDPGSARAALISPAGALAHLPAARVPADRVAAVGNGLRIPWAEISRDSAPEGEVRVLGPDSGLLAVARVEGGRLRYDRVLGASP
jgi:tRNA pseudouridine55 synthase